MTVICDQNASKLPGTRRVCSHRIFTILLVVFLAIRSVPVGKDVKTSDKNLFFEQNYHLGLLRTLTSRCDYSKTIQSNIDKDLQNKRNN